MSRDNKVKVTKQGMPERRLVARDMKRGQVGRTVHGYFLMRTTNSVVFLTDGSGNEANLGTDIAEVLPPGTEITITLDSDQNE